MLKSGALAVDEDVARRRRGARRRPQRRTQLGRERRGRSDAAAAVAAAVSAMNSGRSWLAACSCSLGLSDIAAPAELGSWPA
jgi:hypothetical protein